MNNKKVLKTMEELRIECEDVVCNGKCDECILCNDGCILAKITGKITRIEEELKQVK